MSDEHRGNKSELRRSPTPPVSRIFEDVDGISPDKSEEGISRIAPRLAGSGMTDKPESGAAVVGTIIEASEEYTMAIQTVSIPKDLPEKFAAYHRETALPSSTHTLDRLEATRTESHHQQPDTRCLRP